MCPRDGQDRERVGGDSPSFWVLSVCCRNGYQPVTKEDLKKTKVGDSSYASRIGKGKDDCELGLVLESVPCFFTLPSTGF